MRRGRFRTVTEGAGAFFRSMMSLAATVSGSAALLDPACTDSTDLTADDVNQNRISGISLRGFLSDSRSDRSFKGSLGVYGEEAFCLYMLNRFPIRGNTASPLFQALRKLRVNPRQF